MKCHAVPNTWERVCLLGVALLALPLLTGCEEMNLAIDGILGRAAAPAVAGALQGSPTKVMLAKKREPGELPVSTEQAEPGAKPEAKPVKPGAEPAKPDTVAPPVKPPQAAMAPPMPAQGKRRPPGVLSPAEEAAKAQQELATRETFTIPRDPFKAPTEILPSECPPSMPLCRFDRSQLKLRGVIQLSDGQFKGMVEDPDGRGYFVTPGMQIGGATVTQVTNRGVTLYLHKTRQDVLMPLFVEAKEGKEF